MFKGFYRWLYHRCEAQAAKRRLAGKHRMTPKWHRFSYKVFQQAKFGKYDLPHIWMRWGGLLLTLLVGFLTLWFFVQSVKALTLFQP